MINRNNDSKHNIVEDIALKSIQFRQIGRGYEEQYGRPFEISGNRRTIDRTIDTICEGWLEGSVQNNANGMQYRTASVDMFSGVAGQLIAPSAETYSTSIALSDNAWGNDRFVFWAIFETHDNVLADQFFRYVVTGYTDSDDELGYAARSGTLDPRMRMFVNSIQKLEIKLVPDGYGGFVERCFVISQDEVHFSAPTDYELRHSSRMRDHLARPVDILDTCQTLASSGSITANDYPRDDYGVPANTHFGAISGEIGKANRKLITARTDNHSSATMVSNLLNGISASQEQLDRNNRSALSTHAHAVDGTANMVYANAKYTPWVRESAATITGQQILLMFKDTFSMDHQYYISYNEFLEVFPNAHPRYDTCRVSLMMEGEYDDKSSSNMRGASKEAIEAFRIGCALSNLMFSNGFYEIAFIATNETTNGRWDIRPIINMGRSVKNMRTTDTNAIRIAFDTFSSELLAKVLIPASTMEGGYTRMLSVEVAADLMSDIRIDIRIENGRYERFVFPTFASATYSPLRYKQAAGENQTRVLNTSGVINQLTDAIFTATESVNYRESDRTLTGNRTRPSLLNLI